MKVVFGILMIGACALAAAAQEPKVLAELAASSSPVKGQPFSAETVSESVQTLADGNRIVQTSSGKIYRNGEGKVRREMTGGTGGFGAGFGFGIGTGVSIMDPFGGRNIWLDSTGRTARTMTVLPQEAVKLKELAQVTDEQRKAIEKVREEMKANGGKPLTDEQRKEIEAATGVKIRTEANEVTAISAATAPRAIGSLPGMVTFGGPSDSKWDTKTEELGTQTIEGVPCEGTRRITTIPAGSIGNERPIEIVYEKWYSKDLGMVVMSKHSDPRFGEQTYQLKNIVRAEPDPSLFTVPQGFKVVSTPGATYEFRTVTTPKTPQAPKQP